MSEETKKEQKVTVVENSNPYLMPGAVIISGIIIAIAVLFTQGGGNVSSSDSDSSKVVTETKEEITVNPVTENDHVFGSRDADVFLIEYSDYKCGYCGIFHDTIKEVIDENNGSVAWVYRHTPYQPGGKDVAVASECLAELAGEDVFWSFTDDAFKNQKLISDKWILSEVDKFGVDKTKFNECVTSGKYNKVISENMLNARELGGNGTPYNVLLTKNGEMIKFSGAQPKEMVEAFVNRALNSVE